jgi:hypothetical protein
MKKIILWSLGTVVIVFLVIVATGTYRFKFTNDDILIEPASILNYKNGTYNIDGQKITLKDGYFSSAETKDVVRFFGNEISGDFNNDGVLDEVFLLTKDSQGSGVFYYVSAMVSSGKKFVGTNALLLGDRIAPQTTEFSDGKIIVNFADRLPEQSFTSPPSNGISKYFVIEGTELKVAPSKLNEAQARSIAEKSCIKGGESLTPGKYNEEGRVWLYDANLNARYNNCQAVCMVFESNETASIDWQCSSLNITTGPIVDAIKQAFAVKYPKYNPVFSVTISQQTEGYVYGSVVFVENLPGGYFYARQVAGQWEIVLDGNGAIPCSLTDKGFPAEMLLSCYKDK